MTVDTKTNLLLRSNQVRTEQGAFANTASRLGGLFRDIVDSLSGALGVLNVESYGAAATNTGAVNDVAIAAALTAAAAANAQLYWPAVYPSAASIANLHTVRHRGPGGILRGANTFRVDPTRSQTNNLYCAAAGVAANDGLSATEPTTLITTASYLANYGPMLDGTWKVNLNAATHSPGAQTTVDGLQSRNPIQFLGPAAAYGVPTAIVDGTATAGGICGLYFRNQVRALVRDIKFTNWASADACGLIADRFCELTCDNVDSSGCDLAGIDAEASTRLYVTGGRHSGNKYYNIRAYGQCLVSIGYNSSAHRVTIGAVTDGGGGGILLRDNSSGHIDYCDISSVAGSGGGVDLINQARAHLVSCVFGGAGANYYNVHCDNLSTFIDDGTNTFNAATAKSIVQFGFSIDSSSNQLAYYDKALGFFKWGRTDSLSPKCLFDIQDTATAVWGGAYNSNVLFGVDGATNAYIGLGAGNAGECGLMFADVAGNRQGQLAYLHTSDTFLVRVNATDSFRLHSTYLKPEVDRAPSLGISGQSWKEMWMGGVLFCVNAGTPEGVVTAPIGSFCTSTTDGKIYAKNTGAGNTGWLEK